MALVLMKCILALAISLLTLASFPQVAGTSISNVVDEQKFTLLNNYKPALPININQQSLQSNDSTTQDIELIDIGQSCTEEYPCGRGESGCSLNNPATCFPGLSCVTSRSGSLTYCRTEGESDYCTPRKQCFVGEGACLSDNDCHGSLQCKFNGHMGYSRCEQRGTNQFCSTLAVCKEFEGECASDDECDTNLYCVSSRNSRKRVCRKRLDWEYCNETKKCGEGEGMCVVNGDCMDGLFCDFDLDKTTSFGHCNYKLCTSNALCTQNIGNCQSSSHCTDGLKCSKLDKKPEIGVCRKPMTKYYCTTESPCRAGEGLCLIDSECGGHESRCIKGVCRYKNTASYCDVTRPCSSGYGVCATDSECADKKCVKSSRYSDSRNSCEKRGSKYYCSASSPCKLAEGRCESNDECLGSLRCSKGGVCVAIDSADYCTLGKCGKDIGDCDNNSECETGLRCVQERGTDRCRAPNTAGYCSSYTKCAEGLGYCSKNSDCMSGLRCVRESSTRAYCRKPKTKKFCSPLTPCKENESYCYSTSECQSGLRCRSYKCVAQSHASYCRTSEQCGRGEGDCDNDGECKSGLRCALVSGTDYCRGPGDNEYCLSDRKCNANQGKCASDSACNTGLHCGRNYCRSKSHTDYCAKPSAGCSTSEGNCKSDSECLGSRKCRKQSKSFSTCQYLGDSTFCTSYHPCKFGEGSCSSDSECSGSLVCNTALKKCWSGMSMLTTSRFSEENGWSYMNNYPITAARCYHSKCDDLNLKMGKSGSCKLDHTKAVLSRKFSEEQYNAKCSDGYFIRGVYCSGSYCDDKYLHCAPFKSNSGCYGTSSTTDTPWIYSSKNRYSSYTTCPSGYYAYGMACTGSHCSGIKLYCRKLGLST